MHVSTSRRSRARRSLRVGVATLAAVLLPLAGCAAEGVMPPPDRSSTVASSSPAPTDDGAGDLPGPAAPDDPGDEDGPVLAWLPPGPASPNDPAPDSWYAALQARDCDGLATAVTDRELPLWTAAVRVCRAVETGTEAAWDEAAAAAQDLARPDDADCLGLAVYAAVQRALRFREEHGSGTEVSVEGGSGAACPVQLLGLSTGGIGIDEDPMGSSCGGDEFRLMGRLTSVSSVTVGSTSVEAERRGENEFWFVSPPGTPGPVTVAVEAEDGRVPGTTSFTYVDTSPCEGDSSPTREPTPSPTPTATAPPPAAG